MHLYALFTADIFPAFTYTLDIWQHYVKFAGVLGKIVPDVVGTSIGPVGFDVGPVQSPTRVPAAS